MRRKLLFYACIFLFLVFPSTVRGSDACDNAKVVRYQNIASNVNVSTTYQDVNGGVTFQAVITNVTPDIRVFDLTNRVSYYYGNNPENPSEIIIDGLEADRTYRFEIYATANDGCNYGVLYTYYVNTPAYNAYYNDPVCSDVKEYRLCQKWLKTDLRHEEFVRQVNQYKASLETQDSEQVDVTETPGFNLAQFLTDYYYIFLIIIILFIIGMFYWNERRDTFGF